MRQSVDLFLRRQAALMQAGDIDRLVKLFKTPLPVYNGEELALKASESHVRHAMEQIVAGIHEIAAKIVTHQLIDLSERPGTGAISCLVEFHYRNENAEILRRSQLRYFLEAFEDTFKVAMTEYQQAAFPKVFDQGPTSRSS